MRLRLPFPGLLDRLIDLVLGFGLNRMPKVRVFAHSIAVAADINDVTMMHESIDESGSHHFIAEHGREPPNSNE